MRFLWSVIAAVVAAFTTSALAQEQSVSRVASGEPNTDIRVGVYLNVRPDCTSGPLPSIQLASPPENGKVTVKKAMVTAHECYGRKWNARTKYLNKSASDALDAPEVKTVLTACRPH